MLDLEITLPALHSWQRRVHDDPARFRVLAAGRRWGKTLLGVTLCLEDALAEVPGRSWWVAPSYKLATPGWRALRRLVRAIPGHKVYESDRLAVLPTGGEVAVRSADDPDSLRSEGLTGVVVDEAAYVPEEAWTESLRPALSDRHGWAFFISTPSGLNWFHRLYERAAELEGWARWRRPSSDNPRMTAEELDLARAELGPLVYAQEYEAQFLDFGAMRPFRPEWILRYERTPPLEGLYVVIGVDPAISQRDQACQTAMVAVGTPTGGPDRTSVYVLKAVAGHWSAYEQADQLLRLIRELRPRAIRIEDVAYQRALGEILEREARQRGLTVPGLTLVKPERDKLRRANQASPMVESGRVLFGGPGAEELIRALTSVPHDHRGWDLTDAFGLALSGVPHQSAPATRIAPAHAADTDRKRAVSYAVKTVARDPRSPVVSHAGPSVQWRSGPGRRGADRRTIAAGYAMRTAR